MSVNNQFLVHHPFKMPRPQIPRSVVTSQRSVSDAEACKKAVLLTHSITQQILKRETHETGEQLV